jgi:hypothetical protein
MWKFIELYTYDLCTFLYIWYFQGVAQGPVPWATPSALFCEGFFEIGSLKLFAQVGSKPRSPDLCLLSSWDYRCEPLVPVLFVTFNKNFQKTKRRSHTTDYNPLPPPCITTAVQAPITPRLLPGLSSLWPSPAQCTFSKCVFPCSGIPMSPLHSE